jgi:hypothetical protein
MPVVSANRMTLLNLITLISSQPPYTSRTWELHRLALNTWQGGSIVVIAGAVASDLLTNWISPRLLNIKRRNFFDEIPQRKIMQ